MPSPWAAFLFLSTQHKAQTLIRSAGPVSLHDTGQQAHPQSRPTLHPRHSAQRPPKSTRSAARSTLLTRWTKVHPTAPFEPIQGSQKQKNAPNCNFFAIRDCCGAQKRSKSPDRQPVCTLHGQKRVRNRKKVAQTPDYLFSQREDHHNGADPEKGYRQKSENPSGRRRTPAPAATDIGRRRSGAVNGARLAAQRAAATGGRQRWHRTYTSKSARALQVSIMTRKVRACASKSASDVLTSAGKLKSPWGWPNVPPHGL